MYVFVIQLLDAERKGHYTDGVGSTLVRSSHFFLVTSLIDCYFLAGLMINNPPNPTAPLPHVLSLDLSFIGFRGKSIVIPVQSVPLHADGNERRCRNTTKGYRFCFLSKESIDEDVF